MATRYNFTGGIVTDGLVLHLDAAKTDSYVSGSTTWRDLSPRGYNGTLYNTPGFSGVGKQASITFDGTSEYVAGGNITAVTSHCTIGVWFIATGVPSNNDSAGGAVFAQSPDYNHGIILLNSWQNQSILFGTRINDALATSNNAIINNTINYAVGTYDGLTQKIYINGSLVAQRNYTIDPIVVSPAYQVGRWGYSGYERHLNGRIFNVTLYNKALSATEVQQNFNALRGRFGI